MSLTRRRLLATMGLAGLGAVTACGSTTSPTRGDRLTTTVEAYGIDKLQVGQWYLPEDRPATLPTVVLIHGGYWREAYDRSLEVPVAEDLASRGYLVWNIDYRGMSSPWPATFLDVASAYDHLLTGRYADRVDRHRIAVVGHSAGGQLAAWLGGRHRLDAAAPGGSQTSPRPAVLVPQAGVVALLRAADEHLGDDAPQGLLDGSPAQVPERYRIANPVSLLPSGIRSVLVHGTDDTTVPVSQSETYVADAKVAGDDSTLALVPGDHFVHLDPTSEACARMRDALAGMTSG